MSNDVLQFVREDDFVEYYIFPHLKSKPVTTEEEDLLLNDLFLRIQSISENYCKGYIWHKDQFQISPRNSVNKLLVENESTKGPLPIHFYGVTHYGDNIQDEWFIVSLLLELTKQINCLTARIVDSDGEFLLIEAAEHLPSWANPEICEQRVYIHEGSIHIIPVKIQEKNGIDTDTDSDCDEENSPEVETLTINDALSEIEMHFDLTVAHDDVQKCIQNRIIDFPDNISKHLHRTAVYIPVAVANLLNKDPQLIAPAVQAFCNRDTVDVKFCRAMKYFPPENRTYSSIVFTKCLYAMITHNKYHPDRRTGWKLPDINSNDYKAHSLGVKIACGFEILVSQAKTDSDIEGDKAWIAYAENLKQKGFFQGLIEKSDAHNKLLETAKQYYTENRDSMKTTPIIGTKILQLMKSMEMDLLSDESSKKCTDLPPDDNENWLNISPEELDDLMKERYGQKCKVFSSNGNVNASELTGKLNEFLDHRSGIEGAEFSDDIELKFDIPIKPKRGVFKNKEKSIDKSKSKQNLKVDFDPEAFACAVQNILDFKIPDENWDQSSDSEMSEYNDSEIAKDGDLVRGNIKNYMDQMDKELASTTIGKSFRHEDTTKGNKNNSHDNFDEVEDFKPVDIDLNTLKSMMESYEGEMGGSGPASNLLGSIGVRLEPDMHVE